MSSSTSSSSGKTRKATFAGSWYEDKGPVLASQLTGWLVSAAEAEKSPLAPVVKGHVKGLIGPHAGLSFSGPTAATAYYYMAPMLSRLAQSSSNECIVFVMGPSHHFYTTTCHVSSCDAWNTPLGTLPVNKAVRDKLIATGCFDPLTLAQEEREHSIELHTPFLAHLLLDRSKSSSSPKINASIVPIIVGALSKSNHKKYGSLLAKYWKDPRTFFVVSSDFCHWGTRFRYTLYDERCGEIHESIEELDRTGLNAIASLDPEKFEEYDAEYNNTICGRHPISVLMCIIDSLGAEEKSKHCIQFLWYTQSNAVKRKSDSSVSYASGIITQQQTNPPTQPSS